MENSAKIDLSALMTATNMAKQLGVSDAKVKKAVKDLCIEPTAKKGPCNYYSQDSLERVRTALA